MTTGVARIRKTSIGGETTDINVLTAFQGEEVFFETKPIDFGMSDKDKELKCLVFDVTGAGSLDQLQCYVGYSQRLNSTVTWTGPYSLSSQDTTLWFRLPRSRYFYLKVEDLLPQVTWKLSNIEAFGEVFDPRTGRGPQGRL